MKKLSNDVKVYIVQSLACYDTPSQVSENVYEEFGIRVERTHVQIYDPTKAAGKNISEKLIRIFEETRKEFLEKTSAIPIAHKTVRLSKLQRSYDYFVSKQNYIAANQILEQAAKEVGNFYSRINSSNDSENSLMQFAQQLNGGSLPVVEDIDM